MRYAQISVLITALFLCLLSCRDTIGERHDPTPEENSSMPSQKKKVATPEKYKDAASPTEKKQQKEFEKKKQKASDTLKPKIAVLENLQ